MQAGSGRIAIIGDDARERGSGAGVLEDEVRASVYQGRLIAIRLALADISCRENIVDVLWIEGAIIEADFVEPATVEVRVDRNVAEIKIEGCLRSKAAEAQRRSNHAIEVNAAQSTRAVIRDCHMVPSVIYQNAEGNHLMGIAEGVVNFRVQVAAALPHVHAIIGSRDTVRVT